MDENNTATNEKIDNDDAATYAILSIHYRLINVIKDDTTPNTAEIDDITTEIDDKTTVIVEPDCIVFWHMKRFLDEKGILKSVEPEEDNAYLSSAYDFRRIFVSVDFSEAKIDKRTKGCDETKRAIFMNGFNASFAGIFFEKEEQPVKFVRFEASASMLRSGRVMFINDKYKEDLTKVITLDLESAMKDKDIVVSKWLAYKGLVFSSGIPFSDSDIADKIVVVDDFIINRKQSDDEKIDVPYVYTIKEGLTTLIESEDSKVKGMLNTTEKRLDNKIT